MINANIKKNIKLIFYKLNKKEILDILLKSKLSNNSV